ncbi:MAG: hypothetical protein IT204_08850 [Fimbriimonadaceae bacterium]|nr:hypothetical protein [Fimbriimonadaceae bacterium]
MVGRANGCLRVPDASTAKLTRCRLVASPIFGALVNGAGSRIELDRCTVTGNAKGAFEIQDGGQVRHTGCTFDPGDATVPKEQAAAPTAADFAGPAITVAQDGSGQYRTINQAVAAAPGNARIINKPGVYQEKVELRKPLSLVGQGSREQVVIAQAGQAWVSAIGLPARLTGLSLRLLAPADASATAAPSRSAPLQVSDGAALTAVDCRLSVTGG